MPSQARNRTEGNRASMLTPVEHPVLYSVDPRKVAVFLRERKRYIDKLNERKEVPTLSVASYKLSVDRGLLKTMQMLGRLKPVSPGVMFDSLASEHIEAYIKRLVKIPEGNESNTMIINDAMNRLKVPMSVVNPEARILSYGYNGFERLEGIGRVRSRR